MPIYEYACLDCRKRVSVYFRTFSLADGATVHCPLCHGLQLRRLPSRVTVVKSDARRLESLADPALMAGLEQADPGALAGFMRKMSDDLGEALDGETAEIVARMAAGASPDRADAEAPSVRDMRDDVGTNA